MAELAKLKEKRKFSRIAVSKIVKKIELDVNSAECNLDALEENLNSLNLKSMSLKELDSKIENLLNVTPEEFEEEVTAVQEYEDKVDTWTFRAKKRLSSSENKTKSVSDNTSGHISETQSCCKQNVKLPKLTINIFYGDSSYWLDFWNQFSITIHDNEELSKIEKFSYLKLYLGGNALAAVSGFALTTENYDTAIQLLKRRFGRNDLVISSHMKKLLSVEPVKNVTNVKLLRKFYDHCEIQIRSLTALNVTSGSYGNLLCPIILQKLPEVLSLEYNRKRKSTSEFDITELIEFIRNEVECREASCVFSKDSNLKDSEFPYKIKTQSNKNYTKGKNIPSASAFTTVIKPYCFYCRVNSHDVESCEKPDHQKRLILKSQGRCYKCLKKNHVVSVCKVKILPCELCSSTTHNKLFCNAIISDTPPQEKETVIASLSLNERNGSGGVYLQTCSVLASNRKTGKDQLVRILMDGGSQRSFIRSDLVKQLNLNCLRRERVYVYSFGFAEGREINYEVVEVNLKNIQFPERSIKLEALVSDTITGTIVKVPNRNLWEVIESKGLQIGDTGELSEVKILVGSDYCWNIQADKKLKLGKNLFATETLFGWTIQGARDRENSGVVVLNVGIQCLPDKNALLNDSLKQFWALDSLGLSDSEQNNDDEEFVKQFQKGLKVENGRYVSRLLWKQNHDLLDDNFENAKGRLISLDNKLKNNEWLRNSYNDIILDQLKTKIIEECDVKDNLCNKIYYMPHSVVVRKNVSTTKVRIVYDASSKQQGSVSLNDCLLPGPNLNPSVLDLILRFRVFKYAFSADIEKAFHQIGIAEIDRDVLRFLYFDNDFNTKTYRMTRVPFGVSCSPFILACTIKHHINKFSSENMEVYKMLNSSIYVDDLFYGAESLEQAFNLSTEAYKVLCEAGMNLRKFNTNSEVLKKRWNSYGLIKLENETNSSFKVLGLNWCTKTDRIFLNIDPLYDTLNNCKKITKRNILKVTATIFDPVGLISPFVVRAKLLIQKLWQLGIDFDEEVPKECRQLWSEWCNELEHLKNLDLTRQYFPNKIKKFEEIELHIFCDASIKAYGAVAYFRCAVESSTAFVMAKTRVAPINKKVTLPRLELLSALIAARLVKYLRSLFGIHNEKIFLWTDSTIVLHWINGSPERWKQFVRNRVIEIQNLTDPASWRHCDGSTNVGDILSRGCSAEYLVTSEFWWSGPPWLKEPNESWPKNAQVVMNKFENDLEKKKHVNKIEVFQTIVRNSEPLLNLEKYSKLSKVTRVVAWIIRFIHNAKRSSQNRRGPLTAEEIFAAELHLVKEVQGEYFSEAIRNLKVGRPVSKKSKLYELNPVLNEHNILLVGGRLQKSSLTFYQKHPIIIPTKNKLAELIVRNAHEKVYHSGISSTLLYIRERYWILKARQFVKQIIKKCVVCKRINARKMDQVVAPLPTARIEKTNPFDVIGLDYAGPIYVKNDNSKHYILLCTCAVTRSIHLELTKDLSTATFLLAFRRFVARRGLCSIVYSDNALTFKAADAELKKVWKMINHPDVKNYYASNGIQWRYIIEKGAWWGGFYERLVRSVKVALRKILGRTSLSFDEMQTVLIEVESIVNRRPITYVYDSPHELQPLTPANFLLGNKGASLPPIKIKDCVCISNREILLKAYLHREKLLNQFWRKWHKDYLLNLQSVNGNKSGQLSSELKINDIVIVHDVYLPRNMWRLGRVMKTFLGRDGRVRSCEIKTEKGLIKRPVQLLVNLEC